MTSVTELFGSMVFDDRTMEARLPKETYRALQQTIKKGSTSTSRLPLSSPMR